MTVSSKRTRRNIFTRIVVPEAIIKNATKKYYALNAATKYIGEHLNCSDSNYTFQHELFSQDEREVDVSYIYGIIFFPKNKQDGGGS